MTRSERACQIWSILAWAAKHQQILTYKDISRLIGVPSAAVGQLLEPIQSYCIKHALPPLSIIVVSKATGLPGSGFVAVEDISRYQQQVFQQDWLEHGNPQPDKLELAVRELPSNGVSGLTR